MVCDHYYNIRDITFTTHNPLCSTYSFLIPLKSLETTKLFTVSTVFPFPACYYYAVETTAHKHLIMAPIVPHPHQHLF